MHTEKFPVGIAGVALTEIERQVPDDEPPPLPVNDALRVIGKPVPRQDARAKVTGAVRFTVDVKLPGMLHARILRSPLPHARVQAIDADAAARQPGVRAVLLVAPKDAVLRYVGAPVAAVAATTAGIAETALRLIHVDYAPLPFIVDLDAARRPNAPTVYQHGESTAIGGRRDTDRAEPRHHWQHTRAGNARQPRRHRAGLRPGRNSGRRRISDADPDPLLHGAACHRG